MLSFTDSTPPQDEDQDEIDEQSNEIQKSPGRCQCRCYDKHNDHEDERNRVDDTQLHLSINLYMMVCVRSQHAIISLENDESRVGEAAVGRNDRPLERLSGGRLRNEAVLAVAVEFFSVDD